MERYRGTWPVLSSVCFCEEQSPACQPPGLRCLTGDQGRHLQPGPFGEGQLESQQPGPHLRACAGPKSTGCAAPSHSGISTLCSVAWPFVMNLGPLVIAAALLISIHAGRLVFDHDCKPFLGWDRGTCSAIRRLGLLLADVQLHCMRARCLRPLNDYLWALSKAFLVLIQMLTRVASSVLPHLHPDLLKCAV